MMFTAAESIMAGDMRLMGKTSLLMFPIYGMGAVLRPVAVGVDRWINVGSGQRRERQSGIVGAARDSMRRKCDRLALGDRIWRHGMLYMVLIFIGEYISGSWLKSKGICPWDYSSYRTNIHGVIRLDFAPLWFGTGLLFEQITKKKI